MNNEHIIRQAQLGVPHSRIQVKLGFIFQAGTCQILNFAKNPRQSQSGKKLHILTDSDIFLQMVTDSDKENVTDGDRL